MFNNIRKFTTSLLNKFESYSHLFKQNHVLNTVSVFYQPHEFSQKIKISSRPKSNNNDFNSFKTEVM